MARAVPVTAFGAVMLQRFAVQEAPEPSQRTECTGELCSAQREEDSAAAALSNTRGDSSESVTSISTRLRCTSLQHLQVC